MTLAYLSFPVDSNDAIGWLMLGGHEDSVRADPIFREILAFRQSLFCFRIPVHVNTGSGFNIVEVHIAVFRDQVDHAVLLRHLRNATCQVW